MAVRDAWKLTAGRRVSDVERAVGKIQSLIPAWRAVSALSPVEPETDRLVSMVQDALSNVLQRTDVSDSIKTIARRGLLQWGSRPHSEFMETENKKSSTGGQG